MADTEQDQITQIVMKFINDFHKPLDDSEAQASIEAVFSPSIKWTDHAFHIQREGHTAILGLRKAFNHCNQPCETRVKNLHHTSSGVVVEAIWVGCCKNDIVRPDGAVAVKANGRDFMNHVCFVLEVNPTDKIIRIDEYYNKAWWDGVHEDDYQKMRGSSLKT